MSESEFVGPMPIWVKRQVPSSVGFKEAWMCICRVCQERTAPIHYRPSLLSYPEALPDVKE